MQRCKTINNDSVSTLFCQTREINSPQWRWLIKLLPFLQETDAFTLFTFVSSLSSVENIPRSLSFPKETQQHLVVKYSFEVPGFYKNYVEGNPRACLLGFQVWSHARPSCQASASSLFRESYHDVTSRLAVSCDELLQAALENLKRGQRRNTQSYSQPINEQITAPATLPSRRDVSALSCSYLAVKKNGRWLDEPSVYLIRKGPSSLKELPLSKRLLWFFSQMDTWNKFRRITYRSVLKRKKNEGVFEQIKRFSCWFI